MLTDEERADRKMSESSLQGKVLYRAKKYGWRVMHIPRGQAGGGGQWRSTGGAGKGFPDLVMSKPGRVLIVELKRELNKPDEDQQTWLDLLSSVPCIEVYVWRPSDLRLGEIDGALSS